MSRAALNRLAKVEAALREKARPRVRVYVLEEHEPLPRFGDERVPFVLRLQGEPAEYTILECPK